jgi:hypothetical protein
MEKISLGVSHLVGREASGVIEGNAVHSRATAKGANLESGSQMIGCFVITVFNFLWRSWDFNTYQPWAPSEDEGPCKSGCSWMGDWSWKSESSMLEELKVGRVGRGDCWSSKSGAARLPLSGCRGVGVSLEASSLQPFDIQW